MKNKHITGQLKMSLSARRDVSCDRDDVQAAIEKHQLGRIMYIDSQWYRGILPVRARYAAEDADIESMMTSDVAAITKSLTEFLKADIIAKMGLCGEIILTVDDTETGEVSKAKIAVSEGQISYQRASYIWSESVTV